MIRQGPYDAVLFDLDGTLIDTERLGLAAGQAAFAAVGHPVATSFLHRLIGRDQSSGADIIRAELPHIDLEALGGHWAREARRLHESGVVPKPGAMALLDRLLAQAQPRAIVTSSRSEAAHQKLALSGLAGYFTTLVTVDCVTRPKPAPEPYLLAAQRLGVAPQACLVFEDSDTGAQSAHAAGMSVVQVPDLVPTRGQYAHHVAATLLDGALAAGL